MTNSRPPVRIVHVGLGAFHRAHQAWYTAHADDASEWGIAAFTGRSPEAAARLRRQDCRYTLIERAPDGDRFEVLGSIVEAVDGADADRFVDLLRAEQTAIVTLTVTEAGYRLLPDGSPDLGHPAVRDDIEWLTEAFSGSGPIAATSGPSTAMGRLLLGLEGRHRAGGAPLAVVPCDNMPGNGSLVRAGLLSLAGTTGARSMQWIADDVSFVSTSVDRITPKTTAADVREVAEATGWADEVPVVTEPFHDWVLSGEFPAGRPAWESAGARFVDDIEPFERRKLWLLNGAHSLLAYAGALRGHDTVADAITDAACLRWVHELWDEAVRQLPHDGLGLNDYRTALLERFRNPRIEHRLAQIGTDGTAKLRVRIAPVLLAERAAGRAGDGGIRALASWIALLRRTPLPDEQEDAVRAALGIRDTAASVDAVLRLVEPALADDPLIVKRVAELVS